MTETAYAYPVWLCSVDNEETDERNDGNRECYACGNVYDARTGQLLKDGA